MSIIDINIRIEIDNYVALHNEITDDTHSDTVDELIDLFERLYKYKRINESSPDKSIIAKQEEYIKYLLKGILFSTPLRDITKGVRDKFEQELAALRTNL